MADIHLEQYLTDLKLKRAAAPATSLVLGAPDPAAVTEGLEIERDLGVPVSVASTDPAAYRTQRAQKMATTALSSAPKTGRWLSDPVNAGLAKDDLPNLASFEGLFSRVGEGLVAAGDVGEETQFGRGVRTGATGAQMMGKGVEAVPNQLMQGWSKDMLDMLGRVQTLDPGLKGTAALEALGVDPMSVEGRAAAHFLSRDAEGRQQLVQRVTQNLLGSTEAVTQIRSAIGDYTEQMKATQGRVPNFTDIEDARDFADWFSYNTGQAIPYLAITAMAGAAGGPAGMLGTGYAMGVGDINAELIEEGVDRPGLALAGGAPYAALELLGPAAAPFRGIGQAALEQVAKSYFKRLGREIPQQAVEEFINEAGQEIIKDYTVAQGTGEAVELTDEKLIEWFNAGMAGAASGGAMAPLTAAARPGTDRDMAAASNAGATARRLAEIDDLVAQSQVRGRSPDRFEQALKAQGAEGQAIYVPADAVRELFQAKDMALDEETLNAWGIDTNAFAEAIGTGGDVSIALSTYAAKISGTDDAAWFAENATMDPDEMSIRQAREFNERAAEILSAEAEEEAEAQAARLEERAGDVQVRDQVLRQLRQAGRSPDVAAQEAEVFTAFLRTMADRTGDDILDLARTMPVQIRGPIAEAARKRGDLDRRLNMLRRNPEKATAPRGGSLLEWVREQGGISDRGGDIEAMDAPAGVIAETAADVRDRLSQPTLGGMPAQGRGLGLDDLGSAAIAEGYFPDATEGDDPAALILDAIRDEIAGRPRYIPGQEPDAEMVEFAEMLSEREIDLSLSNDEIAALLDEGRTFNQDAPAVQYMRDVAVQSPEMTPAEMKARLQSDGLSDAEVAEAMAAFEADAPDQPLYVVHNLSAEKLRHVLDLGGLAAPSLAVARGDLGFSNFGEISLIGSPDMANPRKKGVRAFNADVYSPRQPRARFKVKEKDALRLIREISPFAEKLGLRGATLDSSEIERGGLGAVEAQEAAKLAFLDAQGVTIEPVRQDVEPPKRDEWFKDFTSTDPAKLAADPAFVDAVRERGESIMRKLYFRKQTPEKQAEIKAMWFDDDGNPVDERVDALADVAARRNKEIEDFDPDPASAPVDQYRTGQAIDAAIAGREAEFSAWVSDRFGDVVGDAFFETEAGRKRQYTLANVVREMTRSIRNGEGWNYGAGNVRAAVATEFKSLADVKARRSQIADSDSVGVLKDEVNQELFDLADKFAPYHSSGQGFGWTDIFSEFLQDLATGPRGLAQWQNEWFDSPAPQELIDEAAAFLKKLEGLPTEYFEIKMQRAVDLSEFEAAVIPENASEATVKALEGAGIDVIRYERGSDEGNAARQAAIASIGERVFFQGKRGSVQFPRGGLQSGETVINLFENADLSTALHEFGHYFLEAFDLLATSEGGTEAMRADLAAIREWVGNDGGEFSTEQHEKWARGFEAYAMEGKAPSLALADAFARFKAWLTRIYRTVRGLNVNVTPEIAEVMDRMLATDAEIAAARDVAAMDPLFKNGPPPGMSEADYKTYARMARRGEETAAQALLERAMTKVRREREAWFKAERKAVREEVEDRMNRQPVYRLTELMGRGRWWKTPEGEDAPRWVTSDEDDAVPGDYRLDRQSLIDEFGEGVIEELSRARLGGTRAIYGDTGVSPAEAASFFGFSSSLQVVEALQNAGKRGDAIAAEVDRVLTDRHGDPLHDGSIEEEALRVIHNEQQAKTTVREVRYLAEQLGRPVQNMTSKVYRQRAKAMLGRMQVAQAIKPNAFLQAERRAARQAQDAFAKVAGGRGSRDAIAKALQAKEQQVLNGYLFDEARKIEQLVAKKREKMRDYSKRTVREKLEGGYIEQIDALLEDFDFRQKSGLAVQRAENLRAFVDRMIAEGREAELAIDPRLMEDARKRHFTRLSVDELLGLFDTIDNLDHMGRFKQKLINARRQREFEESASRVIGQVRANLGSDRAMKQTGWIGNTFNLLRTADTMAIAIDGGDEMGAAYDELKRDIDAGQAEEQRMSVDLAQRMDDLFSVYSRKEIAALQKPKAQPGGQRRTWSKAEILSLALNTGNADNLARILEPTAHEENRLTRDQLDALLSTLDKRDWEFVQSMWDLIDSYWPRLAEVEKRRTGVVPRKVEAVPFANDHGSFRGGYYPIKYDPLLSAGAAKDEGTAWDKYTSAGHGAKAAVSNGMTKERKKTSDGRTVKLSLDVPFTHLRDTIRLITLSEAIDNTHRLLNYRPVQQSFLDAGQSDMHETLNLWLKDVAQGPVYNTDVFNSLARIAKNNFTMSMLGLNFRTVALQVTGMAQSAAVIGKKNMVRGMMDYRKRPRQLATEITAKSAFMAERKSTFQKDIYDFTNDVKVSSPIAGLWSKVKTQVSKVGFAPIVYTQFYAVDMPTWLGAYRQASEDGKNEEDSIAFADRMVARAQASGLMADRSGVERGTLGRKTQQSDVVRLFTALAGYMITKLNRGYVRSLQARRDLRDADTAQARVFAAVDAAADLTLLYVVEGVMIGMLYSMMLGEEDEVEAEKYAEFLFKETSSSIVGGIPVGRDFFKLATEGYGGGGAYGSIGDALTGWVGQIKQGENDLALRRSIANLLGVTTGLPTTAALRAIETGLTGEMSPAEGLFGSNPLTR